MTRDISRQLALSVAAAIFEKNHLTDVDADYLINQSARVMNDQDAPELDKLRAACEIVGLCLLKEIRS